jgi:hypothetical protein
VNQQRGGFQDLAIRRIETNGASVCLPDMEDVESEFIFKCWIACNLRVLELQEARPQKVLLALCVGRFLRRDRCWRNQANSHSIHDSGAPTRLLTSWRFHAIYLG